MRGKPGLGTVAGPWAKRSTAKLNKDTVGTRWAQHGQLEGSELMQRTIKSPIAFTGVGLHTGAPVRLVLRPAAVEHGVWFRRTDVQGRDPMIGALNGCGNGFAAGVWVSTRTWNDARFSDSGAIGRSNR